MNSLGNDITIIEVDGFKGQGHRDITLMKLLL